MVVPRWFLAVVAVAVSVAAIALMVLALGLSRPAGRYVVLDESAILDTRTGRICPVSASMGECRDVMQAAR